MKISSLSSRITTTFATLAFTSSFLSAVPESVVVEEAGTTDVVVVPASQAGDVASPAPAVEPMGSQDVVQIASNAQDFTTVVAAIQSAGLTETLKGDGPFTIFLPTNAAFAALPEGTLLELMKPERAEAMRAILTFHVVPGRLMAMDLAPGELTSLHGNMLTVTNMTENTGSRDTAPPSLAHLSTTPTQRQAVLVQGANLSRTDIVASNGIIHVIDRVLLPQVELERVDIQAEIGASVVVEEETETEVIVEE